MTGVAPLPVDCTAAQMNSDVSRPSRPTARNAVSASASVPIGSAASSLSCSSVLRKRAVRRIQKTIQVTKPTATIDRVPPKRSCASKLSWLRGEGQQGPEGEAEGDRGRDAEPDGREPVAVSGLDQVGDEDADDEGRLEALTQADQVVREHRVPSAGR